MLIVNDSRRDSYALAVHVEVFDAAACYCCRFAHKAGKQGFFRQKHRLRDAVSCLSISVFRAALIVRIRRYIGTGLLYLCRHRH